MRHGFSSSELSPHHHHRELSRITQRWLCVDSSDRLWTCGRMYPCCIPNAAKLMKTNANSAEDRTTEALRQRDFAGIYGERGTSRHALVTRKPSNTSHRLSKSRVKGTHQPVRDNGSGTLVNRTVSRIPAGSTPGSQRTNECAHPRKGWRVRRPSGPSGSTLAILEPHSTIARMIPRASSSIAAPSDFRWPKAWKQSPWSHCARSSPRREPVQVPAAGMA
jgi:hypothetical protein